jgi:Ca-activated chloride channel family protein
MRKTLSLGALILLSVASLAGRQQAVFSARANSVRVDALVTVDGRVVTDLQASDFEVLDNGVRQSIELISADAVPLNVVMALDMSGSTKGERQRHLQEAGRTVIDNLKGDDRAALLTFSQSIALQVALTSDVQRVRRTLDEVRVEPGSTAVIDASYAGVIAGNGDAGRSMLLVFSDGLDTGSWLEAQTALDAVKALNVVVYSVVAAAPARPPFLRDLASLTGGRLLEIDNTASLSTTFAAVLDEFRHRYLLGFTPRNVAGTGWHKLEVRVKRRNATVTARRGYQAGT